METISIRPGFIPYTLSAAVLITAGSEMFKNDLTLAAAICWLLLVPVLLAAVFDRIEFDGSVIRHRGPLAFILSKLFRIRRELRIAEIETITTEMTSLSITSGDSRLSYHTRISGAGVEIVVRSSRAAYVPFIKALFRATGPDKL